MAHSLPYQRALKYVKAGLSGGLWPQGTRLPGVRLLARKAAVASATMQAVLHKLAESGHVTIEPKKGSFAGTRTLEPQNIASAKLRWEKTRQSLKQDMLMGIFEDQERLPSIGRLQERYAVSLPTLRKALKALVAEDALIIDKRKYHIRRFKNPSRFTAVLLISLGDSFTRFKTSGTFIDFYQSLQGRCIRNAIQLAYCGVTAQNLAEVLAYLRRQREFFGYCLFTAGIPPEQTKSMLKVLAESGRPVAVIDEGGGYPLPALKSAVKVFSAAAFAAGSAMGRFLLELGHTSVAYVTLFHHETWSQQRYNGLHAAFCDAGLPRGVRLVPVPAPEIAHGGNDAEVIRTIEKKAGIRQDFTWKKSIPALEFYDTIRRMFSYVVNLRMLHDIVTAHFAALLNERTITAIVGSQDFTAVLAHEYLKQQNIAVPGRISLCGFDNTRMSIVDDLTSYNFLFGNIAADALAYIINPAAPAFAGRRQIECPGTIIQRSTTGKAP
jgi:DNA-binding LacI/PurR family transcriptional regulator